jgi:hypothetical protein
MSPAALPEQETGAALDDVQPRVVANALMGVHRSLGDSAAGASAGERNLRLRRQVRLVGNGRWRRSVGPAWAAVSGDTPLPARPPSPGQGPG